MTLEDICIKKVLSKGTTSTCYLIGKNKDSVLKLFNKPLDESMTDKFNYLLNYQNDSFIFPHELIVCNGKFLGYVTKRSMGIELSKVFLNMDLVKYSDQAKKLDKDIKYLSSGHIIINDLSTRNILCEKDSLKVIDPDYYKIPLTLSIEEVERINLEIHKRLIMNLILYSYAKLKKKPDAYILKKLDEYLKSNIDTSDFIISIKGELENYYNSEINNIKTFTKILRR